jgi:hypothetical protein
MNWQVKTRCTIIAQGALKRQIDQLPSICHVMLCLVIPNELRGSSSALILLCPGLPGCKSSCDRVKGPELHCRVENG